jgi:hypothetical protein
VLGDEQGDGLAEFFRHGIDFAKGTARGGDGWAGDEFELGGVEVVGVDGKEVIYADEGDGDEGDLGADGEVGSAVEEGLELAVGGAAALRKDE